MSAERFAQWADWEHTLFCGMLSMPLRDAVMVIADRWPHGAHPDLDVHIDGVESEDVRGFDYLNTYTVTFDGKPRYRITVEAIR